MNTNFTKNIKLALILVLIIVWIVLLTKSVTGAILFLLAGLLIYPKSLKLLSEHLSFLKKKSVRIITPILLFIVGIGFFAESSTQSNKESLARNTVIKYIKDHRNQDKPLIDMQILAENGNLFGNSNNTFTYLNQSNFTEELKEEHKIVIFNPKLNLTSLKNEFSISSEPFGKLQDYQLIFTVNKEGQILSKKTLITYSDKGVMTYAFNEVPNVRQFINYDLVEQQQKKVDLINDIEKTIGNDDFWNKFDPMVKQRVYGLIKNNDCDGLQEEFDAAGDNVDRFHESGKASYKHAELMNFLDEEMRELSCY